MRKFKHITGAIATKMTYQKINHIFQYSSMEFGYIHPDLVEKSAEWEEIIEKEYEILCYSQERNRLSHSLTKRDVTWEIHSIKRLSDGEIFTIGDSIKYKQGETNKGLISQFRMSSNDQSLLVEYIGNYKVCSDFKFTNSLRVLEKWTLKKPLFTTEDKISIFEGDQFYCVLIPDFKSTSRIGGDGLAVSFEDIRKRCYSFKANAEDYILMNKPCLSLNEVYLEIQRKSLDFKEKNKIIEALKELIKLKLEI